MTSARLTRIAREVLLTSAALLGVLCILLTSIGLLFGIRPLLFRSGSMSPTIGTGDLSLSQKVAAADLRPGDIVSVLTGSGERVTHRVVTTSYVGGATRELTLKGDANKTPDPQVYDVTSAQRVLFTVPKAGYVVNWFSQAPGAYLLAAYVIGMLLLASGRTIKISTGRTGTPGGAGDDAVQGRRPEPAADLIGPARQPVPDEDPVLPVPPVRRRRRGAVVVGCAVLGLGVAAVAGWALPTWASWTSDVAVSNTSFTAAASFAPAAPVITACSRNASTGNITVTWSAVAGATSYNLKLTAPAGTVVSVTSPFTTTTIAKNQSGQVSVVAVRSGLTSADSVAWTYDGNGSGQACHA